MYLIATHSSLSATLPLSLYIFSISFSPQPVKAGIYPLDSRPALRGASPDH